MNNFYVHTQEKVRSLMYEVFGWMSFGLTATAMSAYYVYSSPALMKVIFSSGLTLFGLMALQLALVIILSAAVNRLSFTAALSLFIVYAVLTGVTLSSIFVLYTTTSIALTFFVAAGMFGAMAIYGATTHADLTAMGSFLMMALFGVILALLVNIFVQSSTLDFMLSMAGVVIFTLLTAFEVQRLKFVAQVELPEAASVALALSLYLNFINLFINLLRIMGQKKQ